MNKFTLVPDVFPDGTHEVPLTLGEDGPEIGLAEVTIKDGMWDARLTLNAENLHKLGVDLAYYSKHHSVNGDSAAVVARRLDFEEMIFKIVVGSTSEIPLFQGLIGKVSSDGENKG